VGSEMCIRDRIKGSKGSKVSIVVDALKKLGQPGAGAVQGTE